MLELSIGEAMTRDTKTKGHAGKIDTFIGGKLLQFRQFSGLSQEKLAEATGITFQQIQKYEKGTNRISAARLYEFSRILDVRLDDFFEPFEGKSKEGVRHIFNYIPADCIPVIKILSEIKSQKDRAAAIKNIIVVLKIFKEKQESYYVGESL